MIRRPPRSTQSRSSAASDVYKRQAPTLRKDDVLPSLFGDRVIVAVLLADSTVYAELPVDLRPLPAQGPDLLIRVSGSSGDTDQLGSGSVAIPIHKLLHLPHHRRDMLEPVQHD